MQSAKQHRAIHHATHLLEVQYHVPEHLGRAHALAPRLEDAGDTLEAPVGAVRLDALAGRLLLPWHQGVHPRCPLRSATHGRTDRAHEQPVRLWQPDVPRDGVDAAWDPRVGPQSAPHDSWNQYDRFARKGLVARQLFTPAQQRQQQQEVEAARGVGPAAPARAARPARRASSGHGVDGCLEKWWLRYHDLLEK